jgi:hypothetical protein
MSHHDETIDITPGGREVLAFSILRPAGWERLSPPADVPNFDDPAVLEPLAGFSTPDRVAIALVASRPRYRSGSVEEWAAFLAQGQQIEIDSLEVHTIRDHPAIVVDGVQPTERGLVQVRVAWIEDGGRLFQVMGMAPQEAWQDHGEAIDRVVRSFRLAETKGPTAPLERPTLPGDPAATRPAAARKSSPFGERSITADDAD